MGEGIIQRLNELAEETSERMRRAGVSLVRGEGFVVLAVSHAYIVSLMGVARRGEGDVLAQEGQVGADALEVCDLGDLTEGLCRAPAEGYSKRLWCAGRR